MVTCEFGWLCGFGKLLRAKKFWLPGLAYNQKLLVRLPSWLIYRNVSDPCRNDFRRFGCVDDVVFCAGGEQRFSSDGLTKSGPGRGRPPSALTGVANSEKRGLKSAVTGELPQPVGGVHIVFANCQQYGDSELEPHQRVNRGSGRGCVDSDWRAGGTGNQKHSAPARAKASLWPSLRCLGAAVANALSLRLLSSLPPDIRRLIYEKVARDLLRLVSCRREENFSSAVAI